MTWVCLPGAPVAQWTERLTTDQKVGGSTPSGRASSENGGRTRSGSAKLDGYKPLET